MFITAVIRERGGEKRRGTRETKQEKDSHKTAKKIVENLEI